MSLGKGSMAAVSCDKMCMYLGRSNSFGSRSDDGQAIDWIEDLDISCILPSESIHCTCPSDATLTYADIHPFSTFTSALLDLPSS